MTLKEYSKKIVKLAKVYPNANVIYTMDGEGNTFAPICYGPIAGNFNDWYFTKNVDSDEVNAICVN